MNQSRVSFGDRLRIELAILRIDWELDGRIPWRVRRRLKNELRSNLIAAAESNGAMAAVSQLGDLRALGASYLEVYRGRLDARRGAWAAFITYVAVQALAMAVLLAFQSGIAAGGGHGGSYELLPGFGPFQGSVNHGFEMEILSPAHLVLMLVAFLIGSRAWRALPRGIRRGRGSAAGTDWRPGP
ncbi:MAG: hypothetical protein E6I95_03870 [Chloroflexi bacterium]|nr:MAG: hypothetical protein E6I95_03870 [Chloroflexota bacterium]